MSKKPDPRLARFVTELKKLDRRKIANLRRYFDSEESGAHLYWLEGLYSRAGYGRAEPHQKNALQLVAGLFALKPGAHEEEQAEIEEPEKQEAKSEERGPNIGKLMGKLYFVQGQQPSTEKYFLALLDCDRDGLGYHMRKVILLFGMNKIQPNWERITEDLLLWTDETRRRWAKDFYQEIAQERKEIAETE